jgi:hypothetical protein
MGRSARPSPAFCRVPIPIPLAPSTHAPHDHTWCWKARLPERKGQPCRVFARARMNSIGVEFEDGYRVVTSRFAVRREAGKLTGETVR